MKYSNVPFNLKQSSSQTSAPSSNPYQNTLNQAVEQRRRLKAMEYSSADPVQSHARERGELLERRINQLVNDSKDNF